MVTRQRRPPHWPGQPRSSAGPSRTRSKRVVKESNGWAVTDVGSGMQMYTRAYDAATLMVAGAACMPTATQVAAWLCRRNFGFADPPPDLIVEVLRERWVPWLADVAKRVAQAPNRDNRIGRWRLCAALLVAAEIPAPTTDDAVLAWLSDRCRCPARAIAWTRSRTRAQTPAAPDDFEDPLATRSAAD